MNLITQPTQAPYFFAAFVFMVTIAACSSSGNENTVLQKRTGETELSGDITLTLTAGTFRSVGENSATARSAAPNATLSVTGGPESVGLPSVEVFNLHAAAELTVLTASFPTNREIEGCPTLQRRAIPCFESSQSIGTPCTSPADCPGGLACIDTSCQPSTAYEKLCSAPEWAHNPDDPTGLVLHPKASVCTTISYRLGRPVAEPSTTRFAVIGSTDSLEKVRKMYTAVSKDEVDFVAILGENIVDQDENGIDQFDTVIRDFGIPTVYIAGPDAVSVDDGAYVVRQLGPHEFSFGLGDARFASFYSAYRDLGTNGLARLENVLRQAERLGDGPLFVFTHTPPLDPNGIRDFGFRSRTEGAQTMSLLNDYGVHYLFAGRISNSDEASIGTTQLFITSAEDTTLRTSSEYMRIDIDPTGAGERTIDGVGITIKRIQVD